jgi:HlyD family secretion protein
MTLMDRQNLPSPGDQLSLPTRDEPAVANAMSGAPPFADARAYLVFGTAVAALLIGAVGVWSATWNISGAVVAAGTVVVDSNVKKVQHPTGGVVGVIRVKEGDKVHAGELLVRLDDTVTRANLQMIIKQLDQIAVRQARLRAEADDKRTVEFPITLERRRSEPMIAEIIPSELAVFESRRNGREGLKAQLRERISQLRQEAGGLGAQEKAKGRELGFAREELAGLETLEKQHLVSMAKITGSRRSVAQLEGDLAQVVASAAQARGKIAEIEMQIMQLDQDLKTEVAKELREQQDREAELSERRIAAEDLLKHIDIRAPQSGIVHQLDVHTVGGVVAPGQPIMLIVPDADRLVVEAMVAPKDIDQVKLGHPAEVRFTAFDQRTTPEFVAKVTRISADLMKEGSSTQAQQSAATGYYVTRLELEKGATDEAHNLKLIPGMPAEVHIKTGERTALSYFIKPLADQFSRAFRER